MAIIDKIQLSGTVYTIGNETTTAVTSASTDNEIPTAKAVYDAIPQGGGGKAVSGGTNISITTGETADTINCTLPISADSKGIYTTSTYPFLSTSNKSGNVVFGYNNRLDTFGSSSYSKNNLFFGSDNRISVNGSGMLIGGLNNGNNGNYSNLTACVVLGLHNIVGNPYEFASGAYNATHYSSTVFGNSGNTLFSVGNGDFFSRGNHNALEIRQNGDIYIADTNDTSTTNYYEKPMIKLQDALGGGGSSYTAGDGIDITNDVISVTGKVDTTTYNTYTAATDTALASKADTATTYTKAETMDFLTRKADTATTYTKAEVDTAIQDSLSGYVYTADNGKQDIFGSKTFIGNKKISFTQAGSNDKLGFTLYDARDEQGNAKEFGAFELNPTGITENGVTHPLLTLNHYRNNNGRDVQTYIGYRQYDYLNSAAYHLLAPLPENAKTPFGLTTNFQNFYMPLGIKVNNSTMVKADSGGVVNLTDAFNGKLDVFRYDTYTAATDTVLASKADTATTYTKTEVDTVLASKADTATTYTKTEVDNAITAATSTKQDTLASGTNIKTINNESILGSGNITIESGGGKAVAAGTNISITTGTTADTINCTLRAANTSGTGSMKLAFLNNTDATGVYSVATGYDCKAKGHYSFASGRGNNTNNYGECAVGFNNKTVGNSTSISKSSGCTLFSVGNGQGTSNSELHNAFEVRQNGDIYCSDGTNDVKLQDTITATSANTTALGGLSLVKLTQSEYDALATKDSNTLYIING